MNIFNIVADSLKALKRHPKLLFPALMLSLFAIIVAYVASHLFLSAIPGQVLSNHQLYSRVTLALTRVAPLLALISLLVFLAGVMVKGMYIDLCYNLRKYPKRPSLRHSFKVALSRYKDLLVYEIAVTLAFLLLLLVTLGPIFLLANSTIIQPYLSGTAISSQSYINLSGLLVIMLVALAILYIAVSVLLWLGPPIIVLDAADAKRALSMSINLGKKEPFRIFGTIVASYFVVAIALFLSRILQAIPFLGVILSFIFSIGIAAFIELVAPIYYLSFHKR